MSRKTLLVGDNPFHGISHFSQERGRARGNSLTSPEHAADLVGTAFRNGADGFMFSVSNTTLSIVKSIRERRGNEILCLYAIVPYAYEYVRLANQIGGIQGLAKRFAREIAISANVKALTWGLGAAIKADPVTLLKTYLTYEISRIRSAAGRWANLTSVLLHQTITDMALALELGWLFESYVEFMLNLGIKPGFNTGNFAYLVHKFRKWNIDLSKTVIAAPFNKVGFQMCPSRRECEKALADVPEPIVVAISILAAGYLAPSEAIDYLASLPKIKGVAVGVSKERHARETFRLLKEKLES